MTKKSNTYELVTNQILSALEQGIVPWHKPWREGIGAPRKLSDKTPYRGINVWVLGATAISKGYESPWWGSYNEIKNRGGQVRKGEKGTPVVYWNLLEIDDRDNPGEKKKIPFVRHSFVFNADQTEGTRVPEIEGLADHDPIEAADEIVNGYLSSDNAPRFTQAGDSAFYAPSLDGVTVPLPGAFESIEAYYATTFHELGHSTGHESRLNRPGITEIKPFGTPDYSREELIAEMTAAFLAGEAGIDVNYPQHSGYIASWLKNLGDDPKLVVQAAAAAQKAANLILGREATDNSSLSEEKELVAS